MVSFLKKLTSSDVSVSGGGGLPPQTVRVAILGDSGVGKSSLIDLLVTGQAVSKAPRSTAGCTVNVVLWDVDAGGGDGSDAAGGGARSLAAAAAALGGGGGARHEGGRGGGGGGQKFFVELWDVSAAPYYEQLRRSLYRGLNGVILVYDAADRASARRLAKWALEVASSGTFVAPLPDEMAACNLGGLPVPVLVVANKSDRLKLKSGGGGSSQLLEPGGLLALCGGARGGGSGGGGGGGPMGWLCDALRGLRGGGGGASGGGGGGLGSSASFSGGALAPSASVASLSDADAAAGARAVSASAAAGRLDWEAVGAYFNLLYARRYMPGSARAGAVAPPTTSALFGGGGGIGGGGIVNGSGGSATALFAPLGMERRVGLSPADDGDRRLDDFV